MTNQATIPTTQVTGPPRVAPWFKRAVLLLACLLIGYAGGYIAAHTHPGPVDAPCYANGDSDPATHAPICYYGRPLR